MILMLEIQGAGFFRKKLNKKCVRSRNINKMPSKLSHGPRNNIKCSSLHLPTVLIAFLIGGIRYKMKNNKKKKI